MRPGPLAVVTLAIATTVGGMVFHAYSGPSTRTGYVRPTPPAPVGVFRDGGAPRRDPAIERVLASELPALIADLLAGGSSEAWRAERFAYLREHPAFAAHGPALTGAWRAMIDDLERWWRAPAGRETAAANELRARVDVVSDQLAALQLGYYLDARLEPDLPRRRPGVFAYRIERVRFVRTNHDRVRVLDARRIDSLDSGAAVLGMKSDEELEDPIVVLDAVEAKVDQQILPVLAGDAFPIEGRGMGRAAGDAIRRELMAALYDDVSSQDRAAARCRELLAGSVRRHEAQHRLDQERGLPHPARLVQVLGGERTTAFAVRARFELSAYLSQIASDVWTPQLTLWNLARHGFNSQARSEEAIVAGIVAEELANQLGIGSPLSVIRDRHVDRDRLARLMVALGGRSTGELRNAAARAWRELFGSPLVRVYD